MHKITPMTNCNARSSFLEAAETTKNVPNMCNLISCSMGQVIKSVTKKEAYFFQLLNFYAHLKQKR